MNVKILGTSATITSSLKFEELEKLEQFTPAELTLKDEDKKPIFRITVGPPSVNQNGVQFNNYNSEGFAQCTVKLPIALMEDKRREFFQEQYGIALFNLGKLEASLEEKLAELNHKFSIVAEHTTIVD